MAETRGLILKSLLVCFSVVFSILLAAAPFKKGKLPFDDALLRSVRAESWNIVGKNVIVRGNIRIPFDNMELMADQAVINIENKDVEASGNVRFLRWMRSSITMSSEELAEIQKKPGVLTKVLSVSSDIFGKKTLKVELTVLVDDIQASRISGNPGSGYFRFDDFSVRYSTYSCRAKSARRQPDGVIEATDAEVSSCDYLIQGNAHHSISAGKIVLTPRETEFYGVDSVVKRLGEHTIYIQNGVVKAAGVPVLWLPVFYKPQDITLGLFQLTVGRTGDWGFYAAMSKYFRISDYPASGLRLHGDWYGNRGFGFGTSGYIVSDQSRTDFFAYGIHDIRPYESDDYDDYRLRVPHSRYDFRISNITHLTPQLDFRGAFEYSSDLYFTRDFFSERYSANPNPASFGALEQQFDHFSASIYFRPRTNDFYTVSEKLPEVRIDVPRQEIFGTNIYYQGDVSVSNNNMKWIEFDYDQNASGTEIRNHLHNYRALRFDTTHFLYLPIRTDYLTVVPRVGFKLTAYGDTSENAVSTNELLQMFLAADPECVAKVNLTEYDTDGKAKVRALGEFGIEASTKLHRTWNDVRIPAVKLDGLRHIVRPYVNYTFLDNPSVSRNYLLYFDDTDRIERQHFIRLGMENRLQTRNSDKSIHTLLALENYWDLYFRDHAGFGNVEEFNRIGNFCTVLTASPLKGLTLSTSFNIDLGNNNEDMPEVERRNHHAGRPGICAKWLNRWNATVSYEIVEDVILNLTYSYERPYSARSSYSMGSTLHQFDAGGFFDKYFDDYEETISAGIALPLTADRRLSGAVRCTYDIADGSYSDVTMMLIKKFHCWEIMGSLSFSRDVDDDERDWDISFATQVRLLGLEAPVGGQSNPLAGQAVRSFDSKNPAAAIFK